MGGLMQHIEKGCKSISSSAVSRARAEKLTYGDALGRLETLSIQGTNKPSPVIKQTHPVYFQTNNFSKDFPKIPTQAFRNGDSGIPDLLTGPEYQTSYEGQWTTKEKKLFPNAGLPVRPTAEQLQAIHSSNTKDTKEQYIAKNIDNPEHPTFNIMRYYNQYTEKYKCPQCV
jgi:palmitoyltransferase